MKIENYIVREKKCLRCNLVKNISDYPKNGKYYQSYCKICFPKTVYISSRKRIAKYGYSKKELEYKMLYARRIRKENPEKKKEMNREYAKENPEKIKCYKLVYKAVKKGILLRKPCQFCSKEKVQGHHPDYSKPLDVIWLCSSCHKKLHLGTSKK